MYKIQRIARMASCACLMLVTGIAQADNNTTLADHGIQLGASYTGEAAHLVTGGKDSGGAYAGQVFFGSDVDLNKLVRWQGAQIKLYFASRHGDNLAATQIGNSTSVQEIYGAQTTRLANFTLVQKLYDDRLLLEAGRSVANIHFLGSELCNYFQTNSACGNPTFVFRTSNFTYWPVSSWAGHAQWWFAPDWYAHVGAYEVNPQHAQLSDHGFDWGTSQVRGAVLPFALAYKTKANQARLPAFYEAGAWYDTSSYTDPLNDASGNPAVLSGQPYAQHHGRSGVYARFEQQLTRPDMNSPRGLILFGAVLAGTSGQLIEDHFIQAGFVQRGTFASRPKDSIAFVIDQQHYSDNAIDNLTLARASAGGSGAPAHAQTMMELSYGIQATHALRVQPNVHYIVDPDQYSEPTRKQNLPDAFVIGLRFDLQLSDALQSAVEEMTGHQGPY